MAYLTTSREGKIFLGNRDTREVHDLRREDTGRDGCRVNEFIKSDKAVGFIIDTLDQAERERYTACHKCINRVSMPAGTLK
jgi:hypothetical protein